MSYYQALPYENQGCIVTGVQENPYLKVLYKRENPLQALTVNATAAQQRTGVTPFKGHLGNPMGPQFEPTNRLLSRYFSRRSMMPESYGYADVAGNPEILKVIAMSLNKINRLQDNPIEGKNVTCSPSLVQS